MERKQEVTEKQIDQAVEATFPASDPVSLHSTGAEVEPKRIRTQRRSWLSRLLGGRQKDDDSQVSPRH